MMSLKFCKQVIPKTNCTTTVRCFSSSLCNFNLNNENPSSTTTEPAASSTTSTPKETEPSTNATETVYKNPVTGEIGGPRGPEPTRYGDWERN
eukprot:Pgem_evm1s5588